MKRPHPKPSYAAASIALALLLASGCKSQQGSASVNPFLAPNRVPPPSTRSLMPGQAQPYYPGDPLPVMQSNAAEPALPAAVAHNEPEIPVADGHLAWGSPHANAVVPASGPVAHSATPQAQPQVAPTIQQPAPTTVAANEPTIAIPDDGDALRFAAATPMAIPSEPRPFVPSAPVALATTPQSVQPTNVTPATLATIAPQQRDVAQAAYTTPVITESQVPAPSPWRSPQVAHSSAASFEQPSPPAPGLAQSFMPQPASYAPLTAPSLLPSYQPALAMNTIDVRMRAVPSPPPEAGAPAMPRIRIPGYADPPPMISSNDGFRSRTSMR